MKKAIDDISTSRLPDGGFALRPGGQYRPDATAWAIMSLRLCGFSADPLYPARARLAIGQDEDGRIAVAKDQPQAFWPTPLAILAWHGQAEFDEPRERAVRFLLNTTGRHFKRDKDSPIGHDPSIVGWPWTEATHSWVEPTSLSIAALSVTGHRAHERVGEGVRLLMDRQLSSGGWNCGNTTVFGTELAPTPESTGLALAAVSEAVNRQEVTHSIDYLMGRIKTLTTPLSLGWSVLGLAAWGERPRNANALIDRCLTMQDRYGSYDTSLISLMIFARKAEGGFIHAFS
ncbi:MAG TPA: prenyltransferase/squalene oxidase repeat-containing protein [Syntrophales bacterium]|nr:prenyltransferase/squalene oxidase repeat-containing protein [Syntrophales bacterium]